MTFSKEARVRLLAFATSGEALWPGDVRDFTAVVRRMATLAPGVRMTADVVADQLARLREAWRRAGAGGGLVDEVLRVRQASSRRR